MAKASERSEGQWKILNGSTIVINSNIQNRLLPIRGEEKYNSSLADEKYLTINTGMQESENQFYGCYIFVNDTFFQEKRCDSVSKLKVPNQTTSLFIRVKADERIPNRFLDSLQTEKYILRNKKSNEVRINIGYNDSLFNYRVFNKVNVRITKKGLRIPSLQNNKILFLQRQ